MLTPQISSKRLTWTMGCVTGAPCCARIKVMPRISLLLHHGHAWQKNLVWHTTTLKCKREISHLSSQRCNIPAFQNPLAEAIQRVAHFPCCARIKVMPRIALLLHHGHTWQKIPSGTQRPSSADGKTHT